MGVGVCLLINMVREKFFQELKCAVFVGFFFFFFQSGTTAYVLIEFYIGFPVCPTHIVSCAVCLFCIRPATGTLFQLVFTNN